jgi:hypothetical protein
MGERRGRRARALPAILRVVAQMMACLALAAAAADAAPAAEAVTPPPGPRPIRVDVGFYLVNLVSVDERSETFNADLYLECSWHDPRLAFSATAAGHETRMYQGQSAADRLQEIWWPDLEFVNTASPDITNRTLYIHADGTVHYRLGLSSTFRADLDLKRFPFDEQDLMVKIQSFEADRSLVVLHPKQEQLGFDTDDDYAGLSIQTVEAEAHVASVAGWNENFSELSFHIKVVRSPSFYVWTIFVPLCLVLLLSCTIFFVHIHSFHDRIAIALACFLACIATQFAMSFNLPKISYLTPIDRLFLVTYSCMALGVAVSVVETGLMQNRHALVRTTDRIAAWGIPALYALLVAFVVLP